MSFKQLLVSASVLSLLACVPETTPEPEIEPGTVRMNDVERLIRVSMALKGTRPSLSQIDRVRAEGSPALEDIVDTYLDSPEFGATIREMHDDALSLMVSPVFFPAGFPQLAPLDQVPAEDINRSVIEAPLRLIQRVVQEGRPYTEIVTADYTVQNGPSSTVWGTSYDGVIDDLEYRETRWTDGRPNAGILSSSWMWTRHASTDSNKNRGRANVLARGLLCADFMTRRIPLDSTIDLSNEEAVRNALTQNQSCVGCHQALDPLAGHMTDFIPIFVPQDLAAEQLAQSGAAYPIPFYSPEYRFFTEFAAPGYYGSPQDRDLTQLGAAIAQDPRFSVCTVQRFYGWLHQVEPDQVPNAALATLHSSFVGGGMNARQLVKDIVLSDDFAVSHVTEDDHRLVDRGMKRANPYQQARMVEDLTGFRWVSDFRSFGPDGLFGFDHIDMLTEDFIGYRVLAGGTDANVVNEPLLTSTGVSQLFSMAFAGRAADHLVREEPERLLPFGLVSDEARVRTTLVQLYLRVLGEEIDTTSPELDEGFALFSEALDESGDAGTAWTVTVAALLMDPAAQFY